MRTDIDILRGTERFAELLRPRLPRGVGEEWIQRCVSILDMVGRPQNAAAYLAVLQGLRSLLGWGYRTGWLKSLTSWAFLYQVYQWCGWIRPGRDSLLGDEDDKVPQFAKPGYGALLRESWQHGRMVDAVVLMTLVCRGDGPDGVQAIQAHIDEIALIATHHDRGFSRLGTQLRGRWPRQKSGFGGNQPPNFAWRSWACAAKNEQWDVPASTREAVLAAAELGLALCRSAPTVAPDQRSPEAPPKATPTTRMKRPGHAHRPPDAAELFALPYVPMARQARGRDEIDPEGRAEDRADIRLALVSPEAIGEAIRQDLTAAPDEEHDGPRRHRITDDHTRAYVTLRQRNANDWLLVPSRQNALLASEGRRVVAELLRGIRAAEASGNMRSLGTDLMLLLIGVGAHSTQEARHVLYGTLDDALTRSDAIVVTPDAYLVRTVPMPAQRYRPPLGACGVQEVGQRVALRLPQEMHAPLAAWASHHALDPQRGPTLLFRPDGGLPDRAISRRNEVIRGRTRVQRFTASRLAKTLPLLVMAATHDVAAVQMVTGNAQGLSPVGCAYFSPTMAQLQTVFDAAIEMMGLTPARQEGPVAARRVGSQMCLDDALVKSRVKALGHGLGYVARAMHRHAVNDLIANHNRMVLYTGRLLEASLATRHHGTVGEMTLADVALDPGWIILADKRIDAAHAARPVVVSPLAVAQIRALASHLDVLSHDGRIPPDVQHEMRAALEGTRPLVFFVRGSAPLAWGTKALRGVDPRWRWPANAMRHRAATHLRLHGCPGDFVASQLGHFELGHVLSLDSPTPLDCYHAMVSGALDAYLKADGWVVKPGYGSGSWTEQVVPTAPRQVKRLRVALEKQERWYLRGHCPSGAPLDPQERSAACQVIDDCLASHLTRVFNAAGRPHLDVAFTHQLRVDVAARFASNRPRVEWALAVLRERMMSGANEGKWVCGDRRKVFRVLIEPSPVSVGMIGPYQVFRAIRRWYIQALPKGVVSSADATSWCWLALGLIVDDVRTDRDDLLCVLEGARAARQMHRCHDMLMVPLAPTGSQGAQVTFLGGRLALLAARYRAQGTDLPGASAVWTALEAWLRVTLPPTLQPSQGALLPWLLDITRLASRLEVPGLLRAVRERAFTPTALPWERMAELFDERPPSMPDGIPILEQVALDSPRPDDGDAAVDPTMADTERALRGALKLMTPDAYQLAHGVEGTRASMRQHRIRCVKQLIDACQRNHVTHLLLDYAAHLLENGTSTKARLVDSTIYRYVCEVAAALTRTSRRLPLSRWLDLDGAALTDFYRETLASDDTVRLVDHLRYFHAFAVKHHGATPVAFEALRKVPRRAAAVEAELVTEREYRTAHALLYRAQLRHANNVDLVWRVRASRVVMILMYRGMLRMGEASGLLNADLQIVDGQCIVNIEENRFRTLKTRNAARIVVLDDALEERERDELACWLRDAWLTDKREHPVHRSPLFPDGPGEEAPMERRHIEHIIGWALRIATGNPDARPHWLRHGGASYGFLRATCTPLFATPDPDSAPPLLRRSDIVQLKTEVGHGWIGMTLLTYIHTFVLAYRPSPSWLQVHRDEDLAHISGLSPMHWRRKRADLAKRGHPDWQLAAFILGMRRFGGVGKRWAE